MGLSDLNFLFRFLPVFFILYILCRRKYRNGLLFAASLIFCGLGSLEGMIILLCSLTVNYILIHIMDFERRFPRHPSQKNKTWPTPESHAAPPFPHREPDTCTRDFNEIFPDRNPGGIHIHPPCARAAAALDSTPENLSADGFHPHVAAQSGASKTGCSSWRRTWLCITIFLNIGLLCYYKYMAPTLPPGISFYTFTLLSAVIDVYRRQEGSPESWLEFGAYTAMFPKLLSGPITAYHTTIRQLRNRETSGKRVEYGLSLLIIGLSFKVLIADPLGILWHGIRTVGFESISTPLAWMGAAAYSVQLLFDFQGYSLMAMGLGHMLGFDLPRNFDHPYRARSVSEYYRRWHISLGQWFLEYLYIPLGGSRMGTLRTVFHLFVVWAVTGIWHGITPNFLLWGLVLGTFIVLEKLWLGKFLNAHPLLSHLYVWLLLPLTWVVFAIPDMKSLGIYFTRLFPFWGGGIAVNPEDWLHHGSNYLGFFLAALTVSCPLADRLWKKYRDTLPVKGVLLVLFWACVYQIANGLHNPFMYLDF